MEENKHKKSRALIITIIILLILILAGYLIFKNRDAFGVKTSATISKIFSPLTASNNSKNLNKIDVQAGENLKKGDSVSVFGTGSNNKTIVVKTTNGDVYGYADQDITNGNSGSVTLNNTNTNGFWDSFSGFLGDIFNGNNNPTNPSPDNSCTNGTDNYPLCTTINGQCPNGEVNPPLCNSNGTSCTNGTDNFPLCTTIGGQCPDGQTNPPLCNNDGTNCTNGADNPLLCTTIGGECLNGATNPPTCNNDGTKCLNGTDNYPLCTTIDGKCPGGEIDPPLCTTKPENAQQCNDEQDNDADNLIDDKDPNCHIDGDLKKDYIPTHYSESTNPPDGAGKPDLTVIGNVTPISTTINTPTTFSANIMNTGVGSTAHSFSVTFFMNTLNQSETKMVSIVPTLAGGLSTTATASINFSLLQDFSIRVCADKNSSTDAGTVDELNENNNCGPFTIIKVGNSLPQPGNLPQCSDTIDNDSDGKIDKKDPNCYVGGDIINGQYIADHDSETTSPVDPNPGNTECSDKKDNDNDGKIDALDPECHLDGDLSKAYQADHDNEVEAPVSPGINKCLLIDKNPLEFTSQEKSDLAELLRKFYLIAPSLKTEDDISLAYTNDSQYQNFSKYMDVLIGQCYAQSGSKDGTKVGVVVKDGVSVTYQGPTTRYGNPWYEYAINRGQYAKGITIQDIAALVQCQADKASDSTIICPELIDMRTMEKILNVW